MQSIQTKIVSRIQGKGRGWSFSKKDFLGIGNDDAIRKALSRLEDQKKIRRVCRGIYDYPKYSKLLGQDLGPDFDSVACAIARKSGWTIRPSGVTALNFLGLSTQVPAQILYLSDGPTKVIEAGPWTIRFKNTALKEIKLKPKTSLMVQAIKSLGRDQFDDARIAEFRKAFSEEDRRKILKDASMITDWVYELIRKICLENHNG